MGTLDFVVAIIIFNVCRRKFEQVNFHSSPKLYSAVSLSRERASIEMNVQTIFAGKISFSSRYRKLR